MNRSPRVLSLFVRRIADGLRWARTSLSTRAGSSRRRTPSFLPQLEQLDARVLPSGTPVSTGVSDYRYGTFDQGVDSSETLLTPANVQSDFGRVWNTAAIDGQVYAQPVMIPNLTVTANGTTTT